ncbi:MAG TPA: methyl-accepting chemotaxis protein [Thermodesulfovibrionales bacterium]|nr:methyl-accepting chemotaxis protein [Thermodesulfovibrionales bacterium]
MKLTNMKVRTQLLIGFGMAIALTLVIASSSVIALSHIADNIKEITQDRWKKTVIANDIIDHINIVARCLRNAALMEDPVKIKGEISTIMDSREKVTNDIKELEQLIKSPEGKAILKDMKDARSNFGPAYMEMIKMIESGRKKEAIAFLFEKTRPLQLAYMENVDKLIKFQGRQMDGAGKDALQNASTAITAIVLLAVASLVLSAFVALWILRTLLTQLGGEPAYIADIAKKIAEGDLTVHLEADRRETGIFLAMKRMAENLKKTISEVKSSAETVATASQELSASSEQMSRGITDQSSRSTQIATATEQMTQTVVDVAKNASSIASSAIETAATAKKGGDIVSKAVEEVQAIARSAGESAKTIGGLGEKSRQIGEIVGVITDIADQTNLLALNAAIEAARAGDQGRGFAVVADEVRKLAERTAKATSEIGSMIRGIQTEVDGAVRSMDETTVRVDEGVKLSVQAGDALHAIVKSIGNLQSLVQQIATATEEMSTASEQVSGDIQAIASSSNEISAGSTQISQSSSDLAKLATNLRTAVTGFKIG